MIEITTSGTSESRGFTRSRYGAGDPGIFFFLADGTMIETNFDYLQADKPISAVNVPLLGGTP